MIGRVGGVSFRLGFFFEGIFLEDIKINLLGKLLFLYNWGKF